MHRKPEADEAGGAESLKPECRGEGGGRTQSTGGAARVWQRRLKGADSEE
jgi:hypothetical protein